MRAARTLAPLALTLALLPGSQALAQEADAEGAKDHVLFSRMPGFVIHQQDAKDFERYKIRGADGKERVVEGRYTNTLYMKKADAKEPSRTQLHRNHQRALEKAGGQKLYDDGEGNLYLTLKKDGREVWAHVDAYITSQYRVVVIEKAAMAQDVVSTAEGLLAGLKEQGRVVVSGIHFDTNKAVLKAESEPALATVAALLQKEASLRLFVVGHTDNVGTYEDNLTLSRERAEAVLKALTSKHSIAAERLRAVGVSSVAPAASNDGEEGRAKNRRVELVKQ